MRRLRRPRRRWLWGVAVLAVAVVGAFVAAKGRSGSALAVRTHEVSKGQVRDLVSSVAAGRVTPEKEVTLRAELSGSIQELRKRRGQKVELGEPLVVYSAQELKQRRQAAESAVALARAQSAEAKANAMLSQKVAERTARLHASGSLSQAELDNAQGRAEASESAVEASSAALGQATANLDVARTAVSKAMVKAPFTGLILETSVEQGDVVSPGVQLLRMADVSRWYVDADIDEADLGRVTTGMQAEVALDAFQNQRITGTVTELAPTVNRDARGGRSISIRIEVPPDPRLRVGMSADVDIIVSTREDVLWIPPNAIMGRGTDRSVYVVEGGHAKKRPVGTGISTWERIEVVSGLRVGEQVVVTLSLPQLADGVRVAPQPGSPTPLPEAR